MRKLLYLMLIYTVLLCACKKYKEGPAISLRSKLNRIEGTWKVEKFYINDIDSTDLYYQKLGCKIIFTKDMNVQLISCNNGKTLNGNWKFRNRDVEVNDNCIELVFPQDSTFNFVIGVNYSCNDTVPNIISALYEIRRLTNRELFIEVGKLLPCNVLKRIELKKE